MSPPSARTVKGYEGNAWFGVGAPKKTPKDIVDKLNSTINAGLADPTFKKKLEELGGVPMVVAPAAFTKFISDETEKWAKVVQFSGAKVE